MNVLFFHFSLSSLSGHLRVGFTLRSGPLRLRGSCSDGSVSLDLQPHREDPGGLSVRGGTMVKLMIMFLWDFMNQLPVY